MLHEINVSFFFFITVELLELTKLSVHFKMFLSSFFVTFNKEIEQNHFLHIIIKTCKIKKE